MPRKPRKPANLVGAQVGVERYHAAYTGKVTSKVGPASKTSSPKPPKPIVGAGKGFRGI